MRIIDKIEEMRIKRGWSVYKLAQLSGLSEKCTYNWYQRGSTPTIQALTGICDAFGITMSQLFAESNLVELDAETKAVFDDWLLLSQEQREAVKVMIKTIKG